MARHDVLIIDLDPGSAIGREIQEILGSCCRLTYVGEPSEAVDSRLGLSDDYLTHLRSSQIPPDAVCICASSLNTQVEATLQALQGLFSERPILLVVKAHDPELMLRLLKRGAADFITPPLRRVEILPRLWRLLGQEKKSDSLSLRLKEKLGLKQFIGESPAFQAAIEKIPIIAKCDGTVLLEGETGTGKEVCARAIHYLSRRADMPLIPVNCGAIPLELIENELFGHERGAFTGASDSRRGLVQEADGGTLFLDEIDSLPPTAQVKILRLLEEREYRPLGSAKTRTADIRLVAATNVQVEEAVRTGKLRPDFYYRLSTFPLRLPPLRDRQGDVLLLARHFLAKFAAHLRKPVPTLSAGAVEGLLLHNWPGNVRELGHVMERALVLIEDRIVIRRSDLLLPGSRPTDPQSFQMAKKDAVAMFERCYIEKLLIANQGNITKAAQAAKKNRRAFWELIRKHHIDTQRYRASSAGSGLSHYAGPLDRPDL